MKVKSPEVPDNHNIERRLFLVTANMIYRRGSAKAVSIKMERLRARRTRIAYNKPPSQEIKSCSLGKIL